jgi:hypothetical protein
MVHMDGLTRRESARPIKPNLVGSFGVNLVPICADCAGFDGYRFASGPMGARSKTTSTQQPSADA